MDLTKKLIFLVKKCNIDLIKLQSKIIYLLRMLESIGYLQSL